MLSNITLQKTFLYICVCLIASVILVRTVQAKSADVQFYSGNMVDYWDPGAGVCSEQPVGAADGGDVPTSVTVDKEFTLGTDKSTRPVILLKQLMTDFNLKDFQAAGVVGNFMLESGGKWLPPDFNQGAKSGAPPTTDYGGGAAYGWAQWDSGRKKAFVEFSVANGYMKSGNVRASDAANYAYLTHELTETAESKVIPALKATTNSDKAAFAWQEIFERAGKPAQDVRNSYAKEVLNAFKSGGGVSENGSTGTSSDDDSTSETCATPSDGGTVGTGESADFGQVAFPLKGGKSTVKNASIFNNNDTDRGGHPYLAYDIYANAGTQVVAFASGTVTKVHSGSLGNGVSIYNDKAKLVVYYTHMETVSVKAGAKISPGDPLGTLASEKKYPDIHVDHLHIDASTDKVRQRCDRDGCSIQDHFRPIGKDLYSTFQALPN